MGERAFTPIGSLAQLEEHGRLIGEVEGLEVAVFQLDSEVVAYENRCPHLAGPVGKGKIARRVCARELGDGSIEEYFSTDEVNIACPWHGYEFDLKTGVAMGDARVRLRRYEVLVDRDEVSVRPTSPRRQSVAPMPAPYEG